MQVRGGGKLDSDRHILDLPQLPVGLKGVGGNPGRNAFDARFRKNRLVRKPQDRRNGLRWYLTLSCFAFTSNSALDPVRNAGCEGILVLRATPPS